MHRLLQIVSVLRRCLNFLQTRATFGSTVPGNREKISTNSSGGSSTNVCACGGPVMMPFRKAPELPRTVPYSPASLGPAVATSLSRPAPPPETSPGLGPTILSSSSSSMSESLAWPCWFGRFRRRHLREWPTPQSLAQTAIRSHQVANVTSQQHI